MSISTVLTRHKIQTLYDTFHSAALSICKLQSNRNLTPFPNTCLDVPANPFSKRKWRHLTEAVKKRKKIPTLFQFYKGYKKIPACGDCVYSNRNFQTETSSWNKTAKVYTVHTTFAVCLFLSSPFTLLFVVVDYIWCFMSHPTPFVVVDYIWCFMPHPTPFAVVVVLFLVWFRLFVVVYWCEWFLFLLLFVVVVAVAVVVVGLFCCCY